MTQDEVKAIIYEMVDKLTIPFTARDKEMLQFAESLAAINFEQGYTQVVAVGIDDVGQVYSKKQQDCPVGQDSVCAERFIIDMVRDLGRQLKVIVAFRHGVGVANPCPSCATALLHFFPETEVVVWAHDARRKIPIRGMVPVIFKKRQPSKNGNGNGGNGEISGK